jgi:hypothetical protein
MPVMINLTSAEHGGVVASCGSGDCGPNCSCGCPYTGLAQSGKLELIAEVEQRYPDEWLAFVIPPGEDEFAPEQGLLVVHSPDDGEVWDAVARITHNQVVHVYFNGALDYYLAWAAAQ